MTLLHQSITSIVHC